MTPKSFMSFMGEYAVSTDLDSGVLVQEKLGELRAKPLRSDLKNHLINSMNMEEKELLKEIENLYGKLKQNINGVYVGNRKIGEPGFSYELYANELLKKVQELYSSCHPYYLDENDMAALIYTIGKEVSYVDSLHSETLKPNAPKKKKRELDGAIDKANSQIRSDLYRLFAHIENLKTSNI